MNTDVSRSRDFNYKDLGNYFDSCKHSEYAWLLEILFCLKTWPQTTEIT